MKKLAAIVACALAIALAAETGSAQRDPDRRDWVQLFNGRNLDDWLIKFRGHDLGENLNDTFRVEDGLLKVRYDKWPAFNGEFGHIFYKRAVLVLPARRRVSLRRRAGAGRRRQGSAGPCATTG